jgi:hypothetical protein
LTGSSDWDPKIYIRQDACSLTTGGSAYDIISGREEYAMNYWDNIGTQKDEKASKEWVERYKSGTTPILTFFLNEPGSNGSTGPALSLPEPEFSADLSENHTISGPNVGINENVG